MRIRKISLMFILSMLLLLTPLLNGAAQAAESTLALGARGEEVRVVQQELNRKGYDCGTADGIFGVNTRRGVMNFQKAKGLAADGVVGTQTRAALFSSAGASTGQKTITVLATGYCPCAICNYPYFGQPSYTGLPLRYGIVATDPKVIPMGSKLYIPGYGEGLAADQGNAIQGNRIDLCFSTHQEALNWGMRTVTLTVY
jgi:3D (Asp-Asp-Asp) domain-containing protein